MHQQLNDYEKLQKRYSTLDEAQVSIPWFVCQQT